MMTRLTRFGLSIFFLLSLLWSSPVAAQIGSIPYPAVSGTVIRSAEYNANFNQVYTDALNRNDGTMLGPLTTLNVVPTANNVSTVGLSGTRYATVYTVDLNASGAATLGSITCTGCVTSTNILNDTILNADINSAAAIAYSKLNLAASLVNADISASAAIELSKLATTGTFSATSVSDSVGSMATIRGGGLGLTSQVQYGLMAASSPTQWVFVPNGTTGQVLTATTGGYPSWAAAAPSPAMTRLDAGSGTSVAAGATILDSVAITGLTALDTLKVEVTVSSAAQPTAAMSIYSTTDSVAIYPVYAGTNITANLFHIEGATLRQDFSSSVKAMSYGSYYNSSVGAQPSGNAATLTTAWTGNWTLGLRHGGVTAGGTLSWSWAVYKIAGQ